MSFMRHPAAPVDAAPGVVFRSSSSSSASQKATDGRAAGADLANVISAHGSNVAQARDSSIAIGYAAGADLDIEKTDVYYDMAPDVAEALSAAGVAIAGEGTKQLDIVAAVLSKEAEGNRELARQVLSLSGDVSGQAFELADKSQAAVVNALGEVVTIAKSADLQLSQEIFKWGAVIFIAALAAANGPAIVEAIR